jgi:hypothetical protein
LLVCGQRGLQVLANEGEAAVRSVADRRQKRSIIVRGEQMLVCGAPRDLIGS